MPSAFITDVNKCFFFFKIDFDAVLICDAFHFELFAVIGKQPEKLIEFVYRGSFRIADGDQFEVNLANVKSSAFIAKARDFESKLDEVFRNSSLKDIYHHSEILTFEG